MIQKVGFTLRVVWHSELLYDIKVTYVSSFLELSERDVALWTTVATSIIALLLIPNLKARSSSFKSFSLRVNTLDSSATGDEYILGKTGK